MNAAVNQIPGASVPGPRAASGASSTPDSGNAFDDVLSAQQPALEPAGQVKTAAGTKDISKDVAQREDLDPPGDQPTQESAAEVAQAQAAAVASAGLSGPPPAPAAPAVAVVPAPRASDAPAVQGVSGPAGIAPVAGRPSVASSQQATTAEPAEPAQPAQPIKTAPVGQTNVPKNAPVIPQTAHAVAQTPMQTPIQTSVQTTEQTTVQAGPDTEAWRAKSVATSGISVPDPGAVGTSAASGIPAGDPAQVTTPTAQVVPQTGPAAVATTIPGAAPQPLAGPVPPADPAQAQIVQTPIDQAQVGQAQVAQTAANAQASDARLAATVQSAAVPNAPQLQSATVAAAVQAVTGTGTSGISLSRQRNQNVKENGATAVEASTLPAGPAQAPVAGAATPAQVDPATAVQGLPDQQPVIDQVIDHLTKQQLITSRNMRDGRHQAIIHLNPDNLGQVTVTMDVRAGQVRLDLAAGQQALSTLGSDLGQLRSQLADAGLNLAGVTLSAQTADSGTGQQPAPRRDDQPSGPGTGPGSPGSPDRPATSSGTRTGQSGLSTSQGRPSTPGSLDVLA